jgi:hypothetical protein
MSNRDHFDLIHNGTRLEQQGEATTNTALNATDIISKGPLRCLGRDVNRIIPHIDRSQSCTTTRPSIITNVREPLSGYPKLFVPQRQERITSAARRLRRWVSIPTRAAQSSSAYRKLHTHTKRWTAVGKPLTCELHEQSSTNTQAIFVASYYLPPTF